MAQSWNCGLYLLMYSEKRLLYADHCRKVPEYDLDVLDLKYPIE